MGTVEYTAEEETGRSSPYHDSQAVLPLTFPTTTASPQQPATVPVSDSPLFSPNYTGCSDSCCFIRDGQSRFFLPNIK